MNLKQPQKLIIATTALSLLSACSRTSGSSPSSQAADSSQTADSSRTTQSPQAAADAGSSHSSTGLDCPVASAQQAAGTLKETPSQIDSMDRQLGAGGEKEIAAAVTQLRSRHPNAPEGEIVNYLITAYCPTIKAKSDMSPGEKRRMLRSFATKTRKLAGPA